MTVPGVIILLKCSQLRGHGVFRAEALVGHHLLPDPHVHVSTAAGGAQSLWSLKHRGQAAPRPGMV